MSEAPAPGTASRAQPSDFGFSVAVLFVALVPRLFVAIAWSKEPVWDGHYYHFGAERIAAGFGYSEDVWVRGALASKPWVHYPVGYSALLATAYAVFGSGLLVAPLLNALCGAALAVVAHRLARHHLSEERARVAAALVALHPGLIAYTALVMTEIAAALVLALAGLIAVRGRGSAPSAGGAAALIGVAALIRPASLLVWPLVLLGTRLSLRPLARNAALAALCTAIVIAPWTIRNCRMLDGCALISTNGGWNLAIGAIAETGRFQTLRASDGCPVVTGQVQQDRCWAEVGRARIRADPARWLALAPKKLAETFNHESFAVEYLHEADPVSWGPARRVAGRELLTAFHRALLAFAAFGVIALPRDRRRKPLAFFVQGLLLLGAGSLTALAFLADTHPYHWLAVFIAVVGLVPFPGRPPLGAAGLYVVGTIAAAVVTHVIFFGEDRYHLVVTPFLCLLAAGALRSTARPPLAPGQLRG